MGVDESWGHPQPAPVNHAVGCGRPQSLADLACGADVTDPVPVDQQRGVAQHAVTVIRRDCELQMLDEDCLIDASVGGDVCHQLVLSSGGLTLWASSTRMISVVIPVGKGPEAEAE